jgi:RimJ/RimL family protein N-acetyltransferase
MIRLRPVEEADLDTIYSWRNDPAITKHLAVLATPRDDVNRWYASLGLERCAYAVVRDGALIGYAPIDNIDDLNKKCEVGVIIGEKQYWSRGIGTKVARAATEVAFSELGMHRTLAVASERNIASIRCFTRAGYKEEGRLRHANCRDGKFFDLVLMSALEHEWEYSGLTSEVGKCGGVIQLP